MWWHTGMVSRALVLLAAFSSRAAAADAPCAFVNPSNTQASSGSGFASNPIEHVGSILSIQWTTSMTNYTIALWQQDPNGGSANLGPIVFQTTEAAVTEVDWPIQLYSFKLSDSPIFFFWLRSGAANLQGLSGGDACTSHYFNISSDPVSSSSSVTSTSAATSTSSGAVLTGTNTAGSPSATNNIAGTSSGGLSTGAQAGIGVGVAVVGVAAISAFIVWYRYLQKKRAALDVQQTQSPPTSHPPPDGSYYQDGSAAFDASTVSHTPKPPVSEVASTPAPYQYQTGETYWPGHQQQPAELDTQDRAELAT